MTRARQVQRSPAGHTAAIVLFACASVADAQEPGRCDAHEIGREIVSLADGSVVYVEPRAFVTSGTVTLLAGTPSYVFGPEERGLEGNATLNRIAGVVLRDGRPAERLQWPLPGDHHVLRAAARPEGGFVVGGVQMTDRSALFDDDNARGLWLGEWDGQWIRVDQLLDSPVRLDVFQASSLLRTSRGWAWSFPVHRSEDGHAVAVFERGNGVWSVDVFATSARPAYTELVPRESGVSVVVVEQDMRPGGRPNAIAMYGRTSDSWGFDGFIEPGEVHQPRARGAADFAVLSWWAPTPTGYAVRAKLGVRQGSPTVPVDPGVSDFSLTVDASGRTYWATHHAATDTTRTVRIYALSAGGLRQVAEVPSPYTGFIAADAASERLLQIAGPRWSDDPAEVRLASLILRFELRCREL